MPALRKARDVCRVEHGTSLGRRSSISAGKVLHLSDARITSAVAQPPGFGELGGGAFDFAFEAIGRGEEVVHERQFRNSAARFKENARRSLAELIRAFPDLTIAHVKRDLPFRSDLLDRVAEGLETAGMRLY